MKTRLSLEYQLLLHCARTVLSEHHFSAVAALLEKPLAWHRVLELASWHRLSAPLSNHLRRSEFSERVPHRIMKELEGIYHDNAARNLYFQAELSKVLQALQAEGIPVIVLKGAALAGTVYEDIGLRPMRDLDLMVKEHHIDRVDRCVRSFGYMSSGSAETLKRTREEGRHYPFLISRDRIVIFEIHRHLVSLDSPLHFDLTGFWTRACPVTIAGVRACVLAPEDLLTHLCLHFFLDRRYRSRCALGQLCDISETIQRYENTLDWDLFSREAYRNELAGPIYCALFTTGELLETTPPESVLGNMKPDVFISSMGESFIHRRVLRNKPWLAHELVNPRASYSYLSMVKSAFGRILPGPSYLSERYGQSGTSRWPFWLYLRRIFEVLYLLSKSLLRPAEIRQDLQVDRWLHSIYGFSESATARRHDQTAMLL